MCDPVLIAAILEELDCFDKRKEKGDKEEVPDEERKGASASWILYPASCILDLALD
jgi:hypothetical protein